MARVDEGHIIVSRALDAKGSFLELWCFAGLPRIGKASTVNEQPERKNAYSVFMEVRPDIKFKFYNSDAAALANNDFTIRCLYRDWNLYILNCQFLLFR